MLQWLPGGPRRIAWNDHVGDAVGSRVLCLDTPGEPRALPRPLCCVAPDGSFGLSIDFVRAGALRAGYGYATAPTAPRSPDSRGLRRAPDDDGIWRVDLATGESRLVLSIAAADAVLPAPHNWDRSMRHWLHHVAVSPSGARMAFLHCAVRRDGSFGARLMTATVEGEDARVVVPGARVSHFCWRDADTILAWATVPGLGAGFYLLSDHEPTHERVGPDSLVEDGHCTYLGDRRWILCDTYPDILGHQHPYLFDTATEREHPLGMFFAPQAYRGAKRCDLHPRASPSGRLVAVDSAHAGGRQMYLIDVSEILSGSDE